MSEELPRFVRDMLASPPARGGGLHNWLFKAARYLLAKRTEAETIAILHGVTDGARPNEIEEAVVAASKCVWVPGSATTGNGTTAKGAQKWPALDTAARQTIIDGGHGLADLWDASPIRYEDDASHTEEVIDHLFPGNALLCIGQTSAKFCTRHRETLRGHLSRMQLIVPSPMSAITGMKKDGTGQSEHTLDNTGPRKFLVIEQDDGTADEQAAVLLHLAERAPLVLAVHSGSKSIHGWFATRARTDDELWPFMRYAHSLGACHSTWLRSQFVRMPDGTRDNGNRQTIYFFNPDAIAESQNPVPVTNDL